MIVKISDWQMVIVIGGIRHEACACLLSWVGVDGHMGPGSTI